MLPIRSSLLVLVLLAPALRGAGDWMLTTADFRRQAVKLHRLDDGGALITAVANPQQRVVPMEDLLRLDRAVAGSGQAGKFTLYLAGGDRIGGESAGVKDEQISWNSPSVGMISLPMRQLAALARSDKAVPALEEPRTEDIVVLANGDSVRGVVVNLTPAAVTLQRGGNSVPLAMDTVAAVYFASAGLNKPPASRVFRVRLGDGSSLLVPAVMLDDEGLRLTFADKSQRRVAVEAVGSIEQINGPVAWLSALATVQNVQIPFHGDLKWPARMDRGVDGREIRFGDRVYARGIGVHAYSRMTWSLEGPHAGYKAFRTQYAMDPAGDRRYANVTVRVKLDERVVHEQRDFRAGVLSPVVLVALEDARTLTLEVDYGQSHDVQDRFNWIEPALLRKLPAPPAPPAPPPPPPASLPATSPSPASNPASQS